MGIIVSSFIGCGKTYLSNIYRGKVKTANWYMNEDKNDDYAQEIIGLTQNYDIVFVPSDNATRKLLEENNIDFDVYYPSSDRRLEFIENQVRKRSNAKDIQALDKNFNEWIDDIERDETENCHLHKLSGKGVYLAHDPLIMQYIGSLQNNNNN